MSIDHKQRAERLAIVQSMPKYQDGKRFRSRDVSKLMGLTNSACASILRRMARDGELAMEMVGNVNYYSAKITALPVTSEEAKRQDRWKQLTISELFRSGEPFRANQIVAVVDIRPGNASQFLQRMVREGRLRETGSGNVAHYVSAAAGSENPLRKSWRTYPNSKFGLTHLRDGTRA